MLFKAICSGLEEAFTLEARLLLQTRLISAEVVNDDVLDDGAVGMVQCHDR